MEKIELNLDNIKTPVESVVLNLDECGKPYIIAVLGIMISEER